MSVIAYFVFVAWGIMFSLAERIGTPSMWHVPKPWKGNFLMIGGAGLFLTFAGIRPDKTIIIAVSLGIVACIGIGFSDYLQGEHRNIAAFCLVMTLAMSIVGLAAWHVWPEPVPVVLQFGCDRGGNLPLHVKADSTIHILQLNPGILGGNPRLQFGVFQDLSSGPDKTLEWPSEREGNWMTLSEYNKALINTNSFPGEGACKCILHNYSGVALDKIFLYMVMDTSDRKQHVFPISFDTLMAGHSFEFYLINMCSDGIVPFDVQWAASAKVRVLGDNDIREVPLNFEKTAFPSMLSMFGPSRFLWNGMTSCKWER